MAYAEMSAGVVYEDFIKLVAKISAHFNKRQEADGIQDEVDQQTSVRKQIYFEVKSCVANVVPSLVTFERNLTVEEN